MRRLKRTRSPLVSPGSGQNTLCRLPTGTWLPSGSTRVPRLRPDSSARSWSHSASMAGSATGCRGSGARVGAGARAERAAGRDPPARARAVRAGPAAFPDGGRSEAPRARGRPSAEMPPRAESEARRARGGPEAEVAAGAGSGARRTPGGSAADVPAPAGARRARSSSRRTSRGAVSARTPRYTGWRSTSSTVQRVNFTSTTRLGSTQCGVSLAGGTAVNGDSSAAMACRWSPMASRSVWVNPDPTWPA